MSKLANAKKLVAELVEKMRASSAPDYIQELADKLAKEIDSLIGEEPVGASTVLVAAWDGAKRILTVFHSGSVVIAEAPVGYGEPEVTILDGVPAKAVAVAQVPGLPLLVSRRDFLDGPRFYLSRIAPAPVEAPPDTVEAPAPAPSGPAAEPVTAPTEPAAPAPGTEPATPTAAEPIAPVEPAPSPASDPTPAPVAPTPPAAT